MLAQPDARDAASVSGTGRSSRCSTRPGSGARSWSASSSTTSTSSAACSRAPGQGQEGPHDPDRRPGARLGRRYLEEVRPELWSSPTTARSSSPTRGRFTPERLTHSWSASYVQAADSARAALPPLPSHHGDADARGRRRHPLHPADARPRQARTTQIYTQVAIRKLKEIHDRTHPGRQPEAGPEGQPEPTRRRGQDELLSTLLPRPRRTTQTASADPSALHVSVGGLRPAAVLRSRRPSRSSHGARVRPPTTDNQEPATNDAPR